MKSIVWYIKFHVLSSNSRTLNIQKNIVASLLIKTISIIISLLLVPITIGFVNTVQYGVWLTLSSVIGWFTFFDLGLTHGFRNKFAEAKANNNDDLARTYVSTTYFTLIVIFVIVGTILLLVNSFVNWALILNISDSYTKELSNVFVVIIVFFCMQMVLKTMNALLSADQKPALASFIDMVGQIGVLLIIIVLVNVTVGSLLWLAYVISAIPVIVLIFFSIYFYNNRYKKYAPSFKYIKLTKCKDIMCIGGKFFIIQISWLLIFQSVNIILLHIQGPESVSIYNVVYKYFNSIIMVFSIFTTPFWSAFTEAYVKKEYEWMRNSYQKLNYLSLLFSLLVIVATLVSPIIFDLWLGEKMKIPYVYSMAMGVYVIIMIRSNLYITLIAGMGKVLIQTIVDVFFALFSIPLLIFSCKIYGIVGVVFVSCFMPVVQSALGKIQLNKILQKNAFGIWNK